jgi:GNAT superfamily N-acetyltransferase
MRTAGPDDATALAGHINAAYAAEAFCIAGDRTDPGEVAALMEKGAFLLDEADGVLRASVYLRRDPGDRWYLGLLSVAPPLQGRGLGRAMVEAAAARCAADGGRFLDLTVVSARKELFPFYGNLGFHPVEVLPYRAPEKLRVPCRLVRMTRCLVRAEDL